jgi:two-component system, OmpR family, sensor histidine kinase ChvG
LIERIVRREAIVGPIEPWTDSVLPPMAQSVNLLIHFLKERADEADLFAKEMAHELKNPLTSLRSAVETAERITDPEQHRRLMSVVVQDVVRLDRLISAITELSRVEAELAATPDERVDLEAMLGAIVEIENAASHSPLDPKFVLIGGGGSFEVHGVESRMAQVFGNILRNARSFSPPGSSIRVAITRCDDKITVTCDDSGPGIPEGKEEVIFQRFYSDRPVDQPYAGHSGLGLSLCQQIVTAHAGQISAENRHDALDRVIGARFSVNLPAAG